MASGPQRFLFFCCFFCFLPPVLYRPVCQRQTITCFYHAQRKGTTCDNSKTAHNQAAHTSSASSLSMRKEMCSTSNSMTLLHHPCVSFRVWYGGPIYLLLLGFFSTCAQGTAADKSSRSRTLLFNWPFKCRQRFCPSLFSVNFQCKLAQSPTFLIHPMLVQQLDRDQGFEA